MRKLVFRCLTVALLVGYACAGSSYGQGSSQYTDSAKSLKALIEELQDAAEKNDLQRFSASAGSLYFTEHQAWFKDVFGERLGESASTDYAAKTVHLVTSLFAAFQKLAKDDYHKAEVEQVNEPCAINVLDNEYPILFSRNKKVPLYSVRYRRGKKYRTFGFFVYADDGFRYLGNISLGAPFAVPQDPSKGRTLRIGGNIQQARLVQRVNPQYPSKARMSGIKGTVRLQAIIGRDGHVADLQLISGHCWLAEAAIEAVSQWVYQPTLLEGQPVEVSTTIDVVFTLSR